MAETGFLKDVEVEAFLAAARKYTDKDKIPNPLPYTVTVLMLETGMRISEITGEKYDYYTNNGFKVSPSPSAEEAKTAGYKHVKNVIGGLHIEDIDWDKHQIFIRKAKGNKARPIPVSDLTLSVISKYLSQTGKARTGTGKIFDCSTVWIRKLYDRITKTAEMVHVHPHLFRNTFAVRYLRRGGDVRVLQKILGHNSLAITERYLKYTDDQVVDDYNKIMQGGPGRGAPDED